MTVPSEGGTYLLLIRLGFPLSIPIGRLGERSLDAGHYAYVGSAFGPGGLAARLGRYASGPKRKHWHIDSLLQYAEIHGALVGTGGRRSECAWSDWVRERALHGIRGFGASDCRCGSHLYFVGIPHDLEQLVAAAGYDLRATLHDRRSMMPYDHELDARISRAVGGWSTTKKKMFGGTCYLLQGNMMCGVYKEHLILRLGEEAAAVALEEAHTRPMDITGRQMKGWVMVSPKGYADQALKTWLEGARKFVAALPPKER